MAEWENSRQFSEELILEYAVMIKKTILDENLLHLTKSGMEAVIEYAVKLSGESQPFLKVKVLKDGKMKLLWRCL
jgi:hypothetical protein